MAASSSVHRTVAKCSWFGEVVVGPGWLRYEGPVVSTSSHAHHAVQIIDAVDPVVIVDSAGQRGQLATRHVADSFKPCVKRCSRINA